MPIGTLTPGASYVTASGQNYATPRAPGGGAIPEPGTGALLAAGLLPLAGVVHRRRGKMPQPA